jgi:ComF family protein
LALCARCFGDLAAARLTGPACGRCGLPLAGPPESGVLCLNCRAMPPHFDCARAFFAYQSPAGALIRRYKFDGEFRLGPHLLRTALGRGWLPGDLPGADAVLPVPLHRRRLRERGFNQALLLARPLARHLGCPVIKRALVRTRYTSQQTLLPMNKRWDNVRNAFAVRRPGTVRGLKLLLVDDVMTTGRTADECAKALKQAGAAGVAVLTLCRTVP